jgi:hypothetical protein
MTIEMSPYANDGYDSDGEDVTLIRWTLSMTPAERLETLQSFADELAEILDYRASRSISQSPPGVAQTRG